MIILPFWVGNGGYVDRTADPLSLWTVSVLAVATGPEALILQSHLSTRSICTTKSVYEHSKMKHASGRRSQHVESMKHV